MSPKHEFASILWATGSFIGGLALGALITPKTGQQNRALLSKRTADFGKWIKQHRKTLSEKGELELQNIRRNVQDGLKRNIPDLYEATEQIELSEHELA